MQEAEYSSAMVQRVNDAIPMGRHARQAELAGLFAYLASDEAAYGTGQVLRWMAGRVRGRWRGHCEGGLTRA
jgi:NAD(P)-dependent dehydrogenase (short-subunit alcohol dehydrogenase family)